jgi:hypothetical protein
MKFLFYVIFLIFLVNIVELRKKKKKPKTKKQPVDPKSLRPDRIAPELYCDACQAIVAEALKKLRGKKLESDVFEALEDICNPELFYVYSKIL